jgi:YhcN/YlaJ family sporulation lipoprotein
MLTKSTKVIVLLVLSFSVFTIGCANKPTNQVRQQGTHVQQVPNQVQQVPNQVQHVPNPVPKNKENRFDIAQTAADRIARLKGVKSANVLVTNRNAYVAAVVNTPKNQISNVLKDQIAREVRTTDRSIQNVYVSTNPEFVDRVRVYVDDIRRGRPVTGFFDELNKIIQRIFPAAH